MVMAAVAALLALGALGLAPVSAHAAFPGQPGEIRFTLFDGATRSYQAVDSAGTNLHVVPGTPSRIDGATSSADGRTVGYTVGTEGHVLRDGVDVAQFGTCSGPFYADADEVLHLRLDDVAACKGVIRELFTQPAVQPFGDQLESPSTGVASPDGSTLFYLRQRSNNESGVDIARMTASSGPTTIVADDSLHEEDPGDDCNCYILTRVVTLTPIDVSPDGQKLLFTKRIQEHETCSGDESDSDDFCIVNPGGRNHRERYVAAEVNTESGSVQELPAFSTSFSEPTGRPPRLVPLAYSPAGDELLLDGSTSLPNGNVTSRSLVRAHLDGSGEQLIRTIDDPPGDDHTPTSLSGGQWLPDPESTCPASPASQKRVRALLSRGRSARVPARLAVRPKAAVAGAAVLLSGKSLVRKGLRVRIGKRSARVLPAGGRNQVRVVVPRAKPGRYRLRVRSAGRASSLGFRVLRRFTGKVGARVESGRARGATIGPSGGELSARSKNGTRYRLQIPPGALAQDVAVELVPVAQFSGLPFSGARVAGVRLSPDGLQLARPATLTAQATKAFPATMIGFASGKKTRFEVTDASAAGRTLSIGVEHFSEHGAAESDVADFAAVVQPFLRDNLTREEITQVLAIFAVYDERFSNSTNVKPPAFCTQQPLCAQIIRHVTRSAEKLVRDACRTLDTTRETDLGLEDIRPVIALQSDVEVLGGKGDVAQECLERALTRLVHRVEGALGEPLSKYVQSDFGPEIDIDLDGTISTMDYAIALLPEIQTIGVVGLDNELQQTIEAALDPARGHFGCTDLLLRSALVYSRTMHVFEDAWIAQARRCGADLVVSPAAVQLEAGATQLFQAQFTDPNLPDADRGVTWSTTGGDIDQNGNYKAPDTPGSYEVTATSTASGHHAKALIKVVATSCTG
jgi:hypothetical protein